MSTIPNFTATVEISTYLDGALVCGPTKYPRHYLNSYLAGAQVTDVRDAGKDIWLIYTKRPAVLLVTNC